MAQEEHESFGVEPTKFTPDGDSYEAVDAEPLTLRERIALHTPRRYVERPGKKPVDRLKRLAAGTAVLATVGIGPAVYVASEHDSDTTISNSPTGQFPEHTTQPQYELDQSVEIVDNESVLSYAQSLSRLINDSVQNGRVEAGPKSVGRYVTASIDAPSEIGGSNASYQIFFDAKEKFDGSPDLDTVTLAGISSSLERDIEGTLLPQNITVFSVFSEVDEATSEDFWTIRVKSRGDDGMEEITDYTNDPRVARNPDSSDTTSVVEAPNTTGLPSVRQIRSPLTPDIFNSLVTNGTNFVEGAINGAPVTSVDLNPTS